MPRPARRAAIRRRGWTDGHRRQLMFGFDHLGCGWGDAVKRPYAAAPEPRDESSPEPIQLGRLGLLEPHEMPALRDAEELLRQYQGYAERHGTPPRRWFHLPLPVENDRQRRQLEAERSR